MKKWQRPKTTRLYLHPPKCERMFTLWREGKLIFGEIEEPVTSYNTQTSAGIWITDHTGASLDFRTSSFKLREDGIPIHQLTADISGLSMQLECFATPERRSVLYARLRLDNTTDAELEGGVGILLRTAFEAELIPEAPDIYAGYASDVSEWYALMPSWYESENGLTDGNRRLEILGDNSGFFDTGRGLLRFCDKFSPGECRELILVLHVGDSISLDYFYERERTVSFWQNELKPIDTVAFDMSDKDVRCIKNLTVQMLQCFAYPVGRSILLLRQGGLQRQVWSFEAMSVLRALSRIGGYDEYVEAVIDGYFNDFFDPSGEIRPLGISWAMSSATALYSFADHALRRERSYFEKYRERALLTFDWLRRTRASVNGEKGTAAGIFPPLSSCDDPLVFQSWCNTDTFNLRGLYALWQTLDRFGDPAAREVLEEYGDYLTVMRALWRNIADSEPSDELRMRLSPLTDNSLLENRFAFREAYCYMIEALDMNADDVARLRNYYTRRGVIRGGLYNRMPDRAGTGSTKHNLDADGRCCVWYVCCHEYYMFLYLMRHGDVEGCREILRDAMKYAMTDEYYMIERYKEDDPWFSPWSPNASASGRVVNMMLDLAEYSQKNRTE